MKRFVYSVLLVLLVAALLPVQQPAAAQPMTEEVDRNALFVPGELVVTFNENLSTRTVHAKAAAMAGQVGAAVIDQFDNVALLSFDPDADVAALSSRISSANSVVRAQPNYVYWIPEDSSTESSPYPVSQYTLKSPDGRKVALNWDEVAQMRSRHKVGSRLRTMSTYPTEFTSGPIDGALWGWDKVQADLIWSDSKATGYVCLLDTGVDFNHPDLKGMVINGPDMVNNDSRSDDDNGHGTHIAGIISAKINSGDGTAVGVSKTKVYSVKVLNAQGYGTTYNIAAGLKTCMKNSYVKVINMSFGMDEPDPLIKSYVTKTVIEKKKLIVAAAGNNTSSGRTYPAGWADDGEIGKGVIAVAAASGPSPYPVWVDRNHDSNVSASTDPAEREVFTSTECAFGQANSLGDAVGTNYGAWVDMAAPGENIYSTTPVNYPFYLNYYNNVASGYAYLSGTSMAAGFVSGAAARVMTTLNSADAGMPKGLKDRLIDGGEPLQLAVDTFLLDGTAGYNNASRTLTVGGDPIAYGQPFAPDPDDADLKVVMAPFCWPTTGGAFGADQDMSSAVYLNVAKSMKRGALIAEVKDAFSALPTSGANVSAIMSGVTYDTSISSGSPFLVLINLPVGIKNYDLKVSKYGSTTGYQYFNRDVAVTAGKPYFDDYSTVSLPSSKNMHVVLDWLNPKVGPLGDPVVTVDLDLYMSAPTNSGCVTGASTSTCVIGTEGMWDETTHKYELDSYLSDRFFGMGTLLAKEWFDGSWSPFAIHNIDGVSTTTDQEPIAVAPSESITLGTARTSRSTPYYYPAYSGVYNFWVTDNSPAFDWTQGYLDNDPKSDFFVAPVVRYWSKGIIMETVKLSSSGASCNGSAQWWRVMDLSGSSGKTTPVNNCTDTLP